MRAALALPFFYVIVSLRENIIMPRGFFDLPEVLPDKVIREERRFGIWDARCGSPLINYYSSRISGERLAIYTQAYRDEVKRLLEKQ
jgi:hypothetical protein